MPVLDTVADYVAEARTLLQDTLTPFRYTDVDLVVALNLTLIEANRVRPDLFLGRAVRANLANGFTTTDLTNIPSTQVQIDDPDDPATGPRGAVMYGTAAWALMRDQEDIQDARAAGFMRLFYSILIGTVPDGLVPQQVNKQ